MPDDADFRGPRPTPLTAGLARQRATERVGAFTRSFLEQIGQFSTSRLWRQKGGTRPVYEPPCNARRAPEGARHHVRAVPEPCLGVAGARLALLDDRVALADRVVHVDQAGVEVVADRRAVELVDVQALD